MTIAVRYFTRSGNTKKLAEAIGEALHVPALPIEKGLDGPVELLFLGGALYGFGVDEAVKAFIAGLTPEQVGRVAVFSTTALIPSAYPHIKKLLDARGIPVAAEEYHCRGAFSAFHKGRPNAQDCAGAARFAKGFIK